MRHHVGEFVRCRSEGRPRQPIGASHDNRLAKGRALRGFRLGSSSGRQLFESGETRIGDEKPAIRRDALPTQPEPNPAGKQAIRRINPGGGGLVASGVGDDLRVRSHGRTVHYALAPRKCLLHGALEYPLRVEMHERLKLARERAGYDSARAGAAAMGVSVDTYTQHENGIRGFKGRAERYARFFRVTPEWLLYGRGDGGVQAAPVPINRMVAILGDVQAGAWHPMVEHFEPSEEIPIVLPGFETASLFALRVLGPSMNQHYPEGTIVVCCPAAEIGVRDGDHVIVENRRNGLVETTVKEVVQEKGGVALWPRSSDPAFQAPQRFKRGDEGVDDGPAITAVVVSSYVIRPVQRKPMIRV